MLEIRQRGRSRFLSGSMPFGRLGTIRNSGRVRKELIEPGAFDFSIERATQAVEDLVRVEGLDSPDPRVLAAAQAEASNANINVLVGHSFSQPLGDVASGTATVTATREALQFEVPIPDNPPSWFDDAVRAVDTRRMINISPGFFMRPGGPGVGARVEMRDGEAVRVIRDAILVEVSLVTRSVYQGAEIEIEHRHIGVQEACSYRLKRRLIWL